MTKSSYFTKKKKISQSSYFKFNPEIEWIHVQSYFEWDHARLFLQIKLKYKTIPNEKLQENLENLLHL